MKTSKNALWLFVLPLIVPAFFLLIMFWQAHRFSNFDAGGFNDPILAENMALRKLTEATKTTAFTGIIRVDWNVNQKALHPTKQRPTEIWLHGMFYRPYDQTLLCYTLLPHYNDPRQAKATLYEQVSDLVLNTTVQSDGTISDLTENGAKFVKSGDARFDENAGLIFYE